MKRLLALLLLTSSISYAQDFREGVLLVSPKAGVSVEALDTELGKHKAKKSKKFDSINVYEVKVPEKTEQAVAAALRKNKHIKFVELDMRVKPDYVANDKYYAPAYHLHKMSVPASWDISEGAGITIAIADTGVRVTHQDLAANISSIPGYNFYDNNSDITDVHGHGTKVASTAAGVTNNGAGISGIAGKAKILPIRIAGSDGYAYYSAMANAITYAANNGARVLNCSYAGGGNSSAIQSAAAYMASKGGVVVWSAGNDNADNGYLDNPNIILVSATNSADTRTSWSSFGTYVDVAAPGEGIYVASRTSDTSYGTASGTSFSSPIVAGVVAQMLAANPKLVMKEVDSILKTTAIDLGTVGEDVYYGAGRVDAYAAVLKAKNSVGADTTPPTVSFKSPKNNTIQRGMLASTVLASDVESGIKKVELYLTSTLVDTENFASYDFLFDSRIYPNGKYTLTAKAYDLAGNYSTTSISITLDNELIAPTVSFIAPKTDAIVGGKLYVSVNAVDNTGIKKIDLFINDVFVKTELSGPYEWYVLTSNYTNGAYTLKTVTCDLSDNQTTLTRNITIRN